MKLIRDRFEYKAGTKVYPFKGYDYGYASQYSRQLGVKHISVTANEDGSGPFFTVTEDDICIAKKKQNT